MQMGSLCRLSSLLVVFGLLPACGGAPRGDGTFASGGDWDGTAITATDRVGGGAATALDDGVLLHAASGCVLATTRDGGLTCFDAETGAVRWHSSDAGRPIAASAETVLAQARRSEVHSLGLVVVSLADGNVVHELPAIPLPAWANLRSEQCRAWTLLDGTQDGRDLVVMWNAGIDYNSGPAGAHLVNRERLARDCADVPCTGAMRVHPDGTTVAMPSAQARSLVVPAQQNAASDTRSTDEHGPALEVARGAECATTVTGRSATGATWTAQVCSAPRFSPCLWQ